MVQEDFPSPPHPSKPGGRGGGGGGGVGKEKGFKVPHGAYRFKVLGFGGCWV